MGNYVTTLIVIPQRKKVRQVIDLIPEINHHILDPNFQQSFTITPSESLELFPLEGLIEITSSGGTLSFEIVSLDQLNEMKKGEIEIKIRLLILGTEMITGTPCVLANTIKIPYEISESYESNQGDHIIDLPKISLQCRFN